MSQREVVVNAYEQENQRYLLGLFAAGRYAQLCEEYCHEGWFSDVDAAGVCVVSGICSYHSYEPVEELARAEVAAHIQQEIEKGTLGC